MKKRGSILILMTWLLILLSLLAASVGLRSRIQIQLSKFQGKEISDEYLMQSAVNFASYLIGEDDAPDIDSKLDVWYGEVKSSSESELSKELKITIVDEESKLNLNKVNDVILERFFEVLKENGVKLEKSPKDLISGILYWRGSSYGQGNPLGYEHKKAPFETIDELRLVQNMTPGDFELLKPFFTTFARPFDFALKVNVNTAHEWVLKALVNSVPGAATSSEREMLVNRIMLLRTGDPARPEKSPPGFLRPQELQPSVFLERLLLPHSPNMVQLVSQLVQQNFTVDSQLFSVKVETKKSDRPLLVEAVLGLRQQILVKVSRGNFNLQSQLNNVLKGYPFEVLYWSEKVVK